MTDRKEYFHAYCRTDEYRQKTRERLKKYTNEKKRINTMKRIRGHTIDELMKIVEDTCAEKKVDYEEMKDKFMILMTFLRDPYEE